MSDPQFTRLVALSDLHLAPAGEQGVFSSHEALVTLIEYLAAMPATKPATALVLNGDVFDFLQIPGYDALSLPLAPQRMAAILDSLDGEPPPRNVAQALRRFTAAGNTLCCLPGNHDAELNLVTVQQVLSQRLGSSTLLPASQGEWRANAGGQCVIGRHGHYGDAFNAISGARMRQAQADGDSIVPMPPGSLLVGQVINPFRRAKSADGQQRFPFVDRLPSDQAVVLTIMLLDARLAGKRLKDALGIGAAALLRKALMATSSRAPLLMPAVAPSASSEPSEPDWIGALTAHLAGAACDDASAAASADHQLDAYFAGQVVTGSGVATQLSGGGPVRKLLLRALGRALADTRRSFRVDQPDPLALDAIGGWGRGEVALAGHTHAAKAIRGQGGGLYINTGTWLDQVVPPKDLSTTALEGWLQQLQSDQLPTWSGRPVAVVDAKGARLEQWDGAALRPWQDPEAP